MFLFSLAICFYLLDRQFGILTSYIVIASVINFAEFLLIKFRKHFEKVQSTPSELSEHFLSLSLSLFLSYSSLLFPSYYFSYLESSFRCNRLQSIKVFAAAHIYGNKGKKKSCTRAPPACACTRLHRALARLLAHDMQTCTRKCSSLSLSLSMLYVLAGRGKHNDGERAKLRAFVCPSVRPSGTRVGNRR